MVTIPFLSCELTQCGIIPNGGFLMGFGTVKQISIRVDSEGISRLTYDDFVSLIRSHKDRPTPKELSISHGTTLLKSFIQMKKNFLRWYYTLPCEEQPIFKHLVL